MPWHAYLRRKRSLCPFERDEPPVSGASRGIATGPELRAQPLGTPAAGPCSRRSDRTRRYTEFAASAAVMVHQPHPEHRGGDRGQEGHTAADIAAPKDARYCRASSRWSAEPPPCRERNSSHRECVDGYRLPAPTSAPPTSPASPRRHADAAGSGAAPTDVATSPCPLSALRPSVHVCLQPPPRHPLAPRGTPLRGQASEVPSARHLSERALSGVCRLCGRHLRGGRERRGARACSRRNVWAMARASMPAWRRTPVEGPRIEVVRAAVRPESWLLSRV